MLYKFNNFKGFIQNNKKVISLLGLGLLAIALPVTIFLTQQSQDLRQRAASLDNEGTITGEVLITVHDSTDEGTSIKSYFLTTSTGETIEIKPSEEQKAEILSGSMVTVSSSGEVLDIAQTSSLAQLTSEATAVGALNIPVILVNLTNSGPNTISKQTVDQKVISQIKNYFNKVSYGKTTLSMPVHGWYTIAPPPSDHTCNSDIKNDPDWMQRAITAADNEIDFTNVKRFLIIVPETDQCQGGGAALSPEGGNYLTQEGKKSMAFTFVSMNTKWLQDPSVTASDKEGAYEQVAKNATHELIHTFGLAHANGLKCGTSRYLDPPPCVSNEYSDNFSLMGTSFWGLNIPHMLAMGWLNDSQVTTVTKSGTYAISPMTLNDSKPKGIRIYRQPNPAGSSYNPQYLYAEYRQPIYPDVFNTIRNPWQTTDVYNGALLHLDATDPKYQSTPATLLIDATPQDTAYNAALLPSIPFTDPLTGVKMMVVGRTSTSLSIQVTFPAGATAAPSPTPTKTPIPTATKIPTPTPTRIPSATPSISVTTSQPKPGIASITFNTNDCSSGQFGGGTYRCSNSNTARSFSAGCKSAESLVAEALSYCTTGTAPTPTPNSRPPSTPTPVQSTGIRCLERTYPNLNYTCTSGSSCPSEYIRNSRGTSECTRSLGKTSVCCRPR